MKTLLLFIFIVWGLTGWCQSQDSVLIRDNWYKRDTTRLKQSLKDSLNPGNEMRIMPNHPQNTKQGIRILSGESEFIPSSEKRIPRYKLQADDTKKAKIEEITTISGDIYAESISGSSISPIRIIRCMLPKQKGSWI